MKKNFYLSFFLITVFSPIYSQVIQTGGFRRQFGIDADTLPGFTKYGSAPSPNNAYDWFTSVNGIGMPDTGNESYFKSLPENNNNKSFAQRMNRPVYTKVNGNMWLEALYIRDFINQEWKQRFYCFINTNGQNPAR